MSLEPASGPGVRVPPPLLFVGGWLVAWVLQKALPFDIDGAGASETQELLGAAILAAGLGLAGWGMATFRRLHTPVIPIKPATLVVRSGPYQFSRNPMYLGLTVAYFGLSVLLNKAWPIVVLPGVLTALLIFVIDREEAHLRAKFGTEYEIYCQTVRRWL